MINVLQQQEYLDWELIYKIHLFSPASLDASHDASHDASLGASGREGK